MALGVFLTVLVVLSTQLDFPGADGRAAVYAVVGLLVTLGAAYSTELGQDEIRNFLMQRVNSRRARTAAVISLCKEAEAEFRAVTFFPVVGIQDDPNSAPREYLNTLEDRLAHEVEVTLVSVSCAEARAFGAERDFSQASLKAFDWIEERLEGLLRRFPERLTVITVPGSAITINVCHNEATALLYFMSPTDDQGFGFKSNDPLVKTVAKGGAVRYASYRERERNLPFRGLNWRG